MLIRLFAFAVCLNPGVAWSATSDRFCLALLERVEAIAAHERQPAHVPEDVLPKLRESIAQKHTYTGFLKTAGPRVKPSPALEREYLFSYQLRHCGASTVETFYEDKNGSKIAVDRRVKFQNQFDLADHPLSSELLPAKTP